MTREKKYKNIIIIGPDNSGQTTLQFLSMTAKNLNRDGETLVIGDGTRSLTKEEIREAIDPTKIDENTNIEISGHGNNINGEHTIQILEKEKSTRNLLKLINEIRPDLPKNITVNACFAGASRSCISELTAGSILLSKGPENQFTFSDQNDHNILSKAATIASGREYTSLNLILKSFINDTSQSCYYSIKLRDGRVKTYYFNLTFDDFFTKMSIEEVFISKVRYAITELLREGENIPSRIKDELELALLDDENNPYSINRLFNQEEVSRRKEFDKSIERSAKSKSKNFLSRIFRSKEDMDLEFNHSVSMEDKRRFFDRSIGYILFITQEKLSSLVERLTSPPNEILKKEDLFNEINRSNISLSILEKSFNQNDQEFSKELAKAIIKKARGFNEMELMSFFNSSVNSAHYLLKNDFFAEKKFRNFEKLFVNQEKNASYGATIIKDYLLLLPSKRAQRILKLIDTPKGFIKQKLSESDMVDLVRLMPLANQNLDSKKNSTLKRVANLRKVNQFLASINVDLKINLDGKKIDFYLDEKNKKMELSQIIENYSKEVLKNTGIKLKSCKSFLSGINLEKAANLFEKKELILYAANHNKELFNKILAVNDYKVTDDIINILIKEGAVKNLKNLFIDIFNKESINLNAHQYNKILPESLMDEILADANLQTSVKLLIRNDRMLTAMQHRTFVPSGQELRTSLAPTVTRVPEGAGVGLVPSAPTVTRAPEGAGVGLVPSAPTVTRVPEGAGVGLLQSALTAASAEEIRGARAVSLVEESVGLVRKEREMTATLGKNKDLFSKIKAGLSKLRVVKDKSTDKVAVPPSRVAKSKNLTSYKRARGDF